MIVQNSQQNIVIDHNHTIKKIGIKISGGADSAIVAYLLAKYISEERPDIELIPITVIQEGKGYQKTFANKVLNFIKNQYPINIGIHYIDLSSNPAFYAKVQQNLVEKLYKNNIIDVHYVGVTKNPPVLVSNLFVGNFDLPHDDRNPLTLKPTKTDDNRVYFPLRNIDKQGICEIYKKFNLLDSLFPLTRSCEEFTENFIRHCETNCWFCQERFWGFKRFI